MPLDLDALNGRLLFAIPKKGRLHEKCLDILAGADIQFRRDHRLDVALVHNHPIALVFLPASDIPSFVALGNVDLGITGHDVILESRLSPSITELLPLGFGRCALQLQVPLASPFSSPEHLAGRRIVTSFEVLAGRYFEEIDDRLGLKGSERTKIEYVGGSVEAACALGLADGIVDLVESGDTMRAAGLHPIATLLHSEAVLITSNTQNSLSTPTSTQNSTPSSSSPNPNSLSTSPSNSTSPSKPSHSHLITLLTSRIAGVVAAARFVLCQYNIPRSRLAAATAITPGRRAPTVSPLEDLLGGVGVGGRGDGRFHSGLDSQDDNLDLKSKAEAEAEGESKQAEDSKDDLGRKGGKGEGKTGSTSTWVAVSSMVDKSQVASVMDRLVEVGAEDVLIMRIDNCRV